MPWSDPEKRRAYMRAYYAANKDRYKRYRSKDDPQVKAKYHARYYQEHKAEFRLYRAAYRERDPERHLRQTRSYSERHREQIRARSAKWRREHPERSRQAIAAWHRAHVEQTRSYYRKRRAAKKKVGGSHTVEQWLAKLAQFDWRCVYCDRQTARLEQDHRIPISRGGSDDISNIVPACRSCNARKHDKTDLEFSPVRRKLDRTSTLGVPCGP